MRRLATAFLAAFAFHCGPAGATETRLACKLIDEAGGSNHLVFELEDDLIQSFRYRRNEGLPQCEIAASRSPSEHAWETSEWTGSDDATEVRLYSDGSEDAHVRITRHGGRIELRIIAYDQWWLCGLGQFLHPAIAARRGWDSCVLGP